MSKLRGSRLESEVDKCRVESNWRRLHELFPLVAAKGSGLESLANFLMGEALLESFIDSFNGAFPKPNAGHKETLKRAKKYLNAVFDVNDIKQQVAVETHLLLAKLHYICGQFEDALSSISKAKLEQDDMQFHTLRTLRLVTEAYAIKGLCLEALPPKLSSRFQKSVRDEQVLDCFEKSAELALTYLQELDKVVVGQPNTPTPTGTTTLALTAGTVGSTSSAAIAAGASSTTNTLTAAGGGTTQSLAPVRHDQFPLQTQQTRIGGLIETAIQRVPISYIRRRDVDKGVSMYRKALQVVDSKPTGQNLQQVLTRQFAEVLLRGVAGHSYRSPRSEAQSPSSADEVLPMVQSPVKFYINQISAGGAEQLFCPNNKWEEAFLLLSISDAIVNREAVLSRAEEHSEIRRNTLLNVKAVQNLLTLVLSTLRQYHLLSDIFDRAMKFAYEDNYIWFQFALSLICQGKYGRAAAVLSECLEMTASDDPFQYMVVAKLCVEQLGHYDDGIKHAQTAIKICRGGWLTNRAQLLLGLAYSLKGQAAQLYAERKLLMKEALTAFEDATRCDPKDHLAEFFLALQLALNRDLDEAKARCQKSLEMRPEQPVAVLLLALILTAENHYADALDLVKEALDDHPLHYGLLVLRMKLEMKLQKVEDALDTAKELLLFWRLPSNPSSADRVSSSGVVSSGQENVLTFDQKSTVGGLTVTGASGITVTVGGGSAASTSGVGGTTGSQSVLANGSSGIDLTDRESIILSTTGPLTEYGGAVSTISDSFGLSTGGVTRNLMVQWRMQANIWLELAELFLDCGRLADVQLCVEEACMTFPNSHQAIYLKGRVHHLAKRWKEAKSCYLGALGIFPNHIQSLRYLAIVYEAEGNQRMAEKVLRDLVKIDPLDHHTWYALGQVLTKAGEHTDAAKCFDMALELEDSSPIMPFSAIPRVVHL